MPGHEDGALRVRRGWTRAADAEHRWRRAVRLLLEAGVADGAVGAREEADDGHERGRVRAGLDRAAGRAADD